MKVKHLAGAVVGAALLSACSSVPLVQHGAYTPQLKSESVKAWDLLAQDLAFKIDKAAQEQHVPLEDRVVFLSDDELGAAFNQGFKELMATELVAKDFRVVADPSKAAIKLRIADQVVEHSAGPDEGASVSPLTVMGYMLTFGLAFDPANRPTYTEVLLNSTAVYHGQVLSRASSVFYIKPEDVAVYKGYSR